MLRIQLHSGTEQCPIVGHKFGNQTPVYQFGPLSPVTLRPLDQETSVCNRLPMGISFFRNLDSASLGMQRATYRLTHCRSVHRSPKRTSDYQRKADCHLGLTLSTKAADDTKKRSNPADGIFPTQTPSYFRSPSYWKRKGTECTVTER
jgi:hypothetical protein